jgi:hypothetical protein
MAFEKKPLSKVSTVTKPSEKIPVAPHNPITNQNGTTGIPPAKTFPAPAPEAAFAKAAPAAAFPVDPLPEVKRGPGRPPKEKISSVAPAPTPAPVILLSDESVKGLIGMVSSLAAYGFSLSTGAPVDALAKVWTFSDGEKAMLAPPAAELINKNAPEWMKKYETEFKLALIAVPILIAKLAMTHAVVKMHNENLKKNELTPSPTVAQPAQSGNATRAAA